MPFGTRSVAYSSGHALKMMMGKMIDIGDGFNGLLLANFHLARYFG